MARKLSAYNRHVRAEMKRGKTMKQAAASWRAKKRGGSTRKRSTRRRSTRAAPRRKTTVGTRIGGFSPLGIVKAGLLYVATSLVMNRAAPQLGAVPGAAELATGAAAAATGMPGKAFLALGAAKFVALQASRIANGGLNGGVGGYDY